MKILFVENKKIFINWASTTYKHKYNELLKSPLFDVVDLDNTINISIDDYKWILFGWHGISINKYYCEPKHTFYKKYIPTLETMKQIDIKTSHLLTHCNKALYVQDIHSDDYNNGIDGLINFINTYNFKILITPYYNTNSINTIRSKCNIIVKHIPHYINENIFNDRNLKKEYDILIFGNDNKIYYPFRHRIIKLLESETNITSYRVPKIRNYFKFDTSNSEINLSKLINKAHLTLCTKSKFDYLLSKYFETSMSGSVILGDMSIDGKYIWTDNYIHINNDMTDDEILKKIYLTLNNKQHINSIKNIMLNKMKLYHLSNYAYDLSKCFN